MPAACRPPLRFQRPQLPTPSAVERHFARSREARWFSNDGPCAVELRGRLERYVGGGAHAVPLASGTAALLVALAATDVVHRGPGHPGLVAMPSYTFVATAQAVLWAGLTPLFVDVDPESWHLDGDALQLALERHGGQIAAILACSTFGAAPSATTRHSWERAARDAGVPVIVDSAAGFGSQDEDGRPLGLQGRAEVFSFHATKPLAIGEGGAIVTRDAALARKARRLANFGFDEQREVVEPFGLNAKLSELHAATALAALDDFDATLAARRSRAAVMRAALEPAGFGFQAGAEGSAWQFVPVLARSGEHRDAVLAAGRARNIEIRTYHRPLHRMACFAQAPRMESLAVTEDLATRGLSLPMAVDLTDAELHRVVDALLT